MEGDEHASRAEDVQMNGPVNPINEGETDEEGEDIEMGKNISDDSSEEEEEDEEAERKVREGFIVDEDEDDAGAREDSCEFMEVSGSCLDLRARSRSLRKKKE